MLEAALEESAPSLLGAGGVVVDGIFVEGAPNMIRAGLEEQAPSFSGAVDESGSLLQYFSFYGHPFPFHPEKFNSMLPPTS
jgi:hypothetical protein